MPNQFPPSLKHIKTTQQQERLNTHKSKNKQRRHRQPLGQNENPSEIQALVPVLRADQANNPRNQRVGIRKRLFRKLIIRHNKNHTDHGGSENRHGHNRQRPPLQRQRLVDAPGSRASGARPRRARHGICLGRVVAHVQDVREVDFDAVAESRQLQQARKRAETQQPAPVGRDRAYVDMTVASEAEGDA